MSGFETIDDIVAARRRIAPHIRRRPVIADAEGAV